MATEQTCVYFYKKHPNAREPKRMTQESAGYDIYALEDVMLFKNETRIIKTGLIMAIPKGFYGRITDRSSMVVNKSLTVEAGTIDSDFRGEVKVVMRNFGEDTQSIQAGDRIAQIIIQPYQVVEWRDRSYVFEDDDGFWTTYEGKEITKRSKPIPIQRKIKDFIKSKDGKEEKKTLLPNTGKSMKVEMQSKIWQHELDNKVKQLANMMKPEAKPIPDNSMDGTIQLEDLKIDSGFDFQKTFEEVTKWHPDNVSHELPPEAKELLKTIPKRSGGFGSTGK